MRPNVRLTAQRSIVGGEGVKQVGNVHCSVAVDVGKRPRRHPARDCLRDSGARVVDATQTTILARLAEQCGEADPRDFAEWWNGSGKAR